MNCDKCDQLATVHITDIVGGVKKEVHLCETHAQELSQSIDVDFSMPGMLGKLAQAIPVQQEQQKEMRCGECGMTYSEFRRGGRLGCARDYQVFGDVLAGVLEKIHGGAAHLGKVPSRATQSVAEESEIIQLRNELAQAVEREDFERAARLRDEIRRKEGKS